MANSNSNASGAIGLELLQIAFIVLKLLDKIDWSWWWVLSVTWIPVLIIGIPFSIWVLIQIIKK